MLRQRGRGRGVSTDPPRSSVGMCRGSPARILPCPKPSRGLGAAPAPPPPDPPMAPTGSGILPWPPTLPGGRRGWEQTRLRREDPGEPVLPAAPAGRAPGPAQRPGMQHPPAAGTGEGKKGEGSRGRHGDLEDPASQPSAGPQIPVGRCSPMATGQMFEVPAVLWGWKHQQQLQRDPRDIPRSPPAPPPTAPDPPKPPPWELR